MILEVARLDVVPGQEQAFLQAFEGARPLIEGAEGCRGVELQRCVEVPSRFLLLVRWRRLADHVEGFRSSAAYQDWKRRLHHFYDPFPTVEHYECPVDAGEPESSEGR